MKATKILPLTLGLNLILAALVAFFHSSKRPAPPAATSTQLPASPITRHNQITVTNVSTNVMGMNWSQVETEDFPVLIANLRESGCPEHVVRGIVLGRLENIYRIKRQSVMEWPELEPWEGQARRMKIADDIRAAEWTQSDTLSARARELLGIAYEPEMYGLWRTEGVVQIFLGFLSDEKSFQVIAAVGEAMKAGRKIEVAAKGILIPDDNRHLMAVGDDLLAEFQRRLEPSEVTELRLRAQAILIMEKCRSMKAVDLSGADLRRICELSFVLRDVLKEGLMFGGRDDFLTEEEQARRQAAFDQKLATLLNPVQAQQYQLGANEDYLAAVKFTREKQMPRAAAEKIARAFGDARDQAADIRKDKTLTEAEQRAALALLGATLKNSVNSTMGVHAENFLQEHGELLNELVPSTPTK